MWFFETMAQFYNWILLTLGVEDMIFGVLFILGPVFGLTVTFIFVVGSKRIDPLFVMLMAAGLFFAFGMLPVFVMYDRLQECKKEVITYLEEYDSTVFVLNCRSRIDMNGEFGEWNLQKIPQLETPKRK